MRRMKFTMRGEAPQAWRGAKPRRPVMAGPGRLRKIALLGGAKKTLVYAPWNDLSWELWAHASCRMFCKREPDLLFDLHPPELWRSPTKKFWDSYYRDWLKQNHIPIMMQERYADVPCSIRYPLETMVTEFPRGYMTNTVSYMVALALMEGVTHIGLFGCNYDSNSEYGPQRGSAEYWLGVAEGRGVHLCLPPLCDLLNRPALMYGYESHPNGVRDPSYTFTIGPGDLPKIATADKAGNMTAVQLVQADGPGAPPLRDIGVPPALDRRDGLPAHLLNPNIKVA